MKRNRGSEDEHKTEIESLRRQRELESSEGGQGMSEGGEQRLR